MLASNIESYLRLIPSLLLDEATSGNDSAVIGVDSFQSEHSGTVSDVYVNLPDGSRRYVYRTESSPGTYTIRPYAHPDSEG